MSRKFLGKLGAAALAAAVVLPSGDAASSDRRVSCQSGIVGTHLLTIRDQGGFIISRSVVAFHDDGTFIAIGSTQGQGVEGAAFSEEIGSYECTGRRTAKGLLLDFGFLDPPDIGRTDWEIRMDSLTKSIRGTFVLYIILDAPEADPLAEGLNPVGSFTFEGVRVPARDR